MKTEHRRPRIFFGWWTVLTGSFLCLWGYGYYYIGMSALFKPIALELGLSRAATSVAASIGRFQGGFESLLTGWLTDKFGPRWIIITGVFIIGLGLVLMNSIHSIWAYYLVWGVITGTGINIALSLSLDKAISNWFVKKRGLALSIRWTFTGLATMIVLPLVAFWVSTLGWRMTCVIGGLVMWVVGLPLSWFFIKNQRPEVYGLLPDGAPLSGDLLDSDQMVERGVAYAAEVHEIEFTLGEAFRTLAYWQLLAANCAFGMVVPVITIHCIPFLTDLGLDPVRAALLLGLMSAISIPMRLAAGIMADRVHIQKLRYVLAAAYFIQAVGIGLFLVKQTVVTAYVFIFFYYVGMGSSMTLFGAIRARYFGRKSVGSIGGTAAAIMTPFAMLAPVYAGWTYDTTDSYVNAFTLFAVLLIAAAIIMFQTRPPKPPEHLE